jgi:hypothetical protein
MERNRSPDDSFGKRGWYEVFIAYIGTIWWSDRKMRERFYS